MEIQFSRSVFVCQAPFLGINITSQISNKNKIRERRYCEWAEYKYKEEKRREESE
jgi:hypothetical protein